MKVVYAQKIYPDPSVESIFLAGPTLRNRTVTSLRSWREDALKILEEREFNGEVIVPEFEGWGDFVTEGVDPDELWEKQVDWELIGLARANVILFWVPRDLKLNPGFTTNVEYGVWITQRPNKIVLGYPEGAPKMRYMHRLANDYHVPVCFSLAETIDAAIGRLKRGTGDLNP